MSMFDITLRALDIIAKVAETFKFSAWTEKLDFQSGSVLSHSREMDSESQLFTSILGPISA